MAEALREVWTWNGEHNLVTRAQSSFEAALQVSQRAPLSCKANVLLRFGLFCADQVAKHQQQEPGGNDSLAIAAVSHVLDSMRLGHDDAIEAFPRILDFASRSSLLVDALCDGASSVPSWMFLRWTAQMLSQLGLSSLHRRSVLASLLRMAQDYPQALFFPFALTRSDLSAVHDDDISYALKRLGDLLVLPQLDLLCRELGALVHPELAFKDFLLSCKNAIHTGDSDLLLSIRNEYVAGYLDSDRTPVLKAFSRHHGEPIRRALGTIFSHVCMLRNIIPLL
jgi:hypothetical protein